MDIIYKTDSDEHLINIGVKSEPQWDALTEYEIIEDINAIDDYLDDFAWDGE